MNVSFYVDKVKFGEGAEAVEAQGVQIDLEGIQYDELVDMFFLLQEGANASNIDVEMKKSFEEQVAGQMAFDFEKGCIAGAGVEEEIACCEEAQLLAFAEELLKEQSNEGPTAQDLFVYNLLKQIQGRDEEEAQKEQIAKARAMFGKEAIGHSIKQPLGYRFIQL